MAIELARAGAHVVALARTVGALEELDDEIKAAGGAATLVPCDVTDWPALDRLAAAIAARWGRLDIFVGNAGLLGPLTPIAQLDPRQWDKVQAVNVTANLALIRALDSLLRASDAGRVAMLTSAAAHRAELRPYWGAYAMTKAAIDTLVRIYAAETRNVSAVRIMAVNPGPLRTRMRAQAMPGEDPSSLRTPAELAPKVVALCSPAWADTGRLYDFPTDRVLDWQAPAASPGDLS